jgi:hypothetical protein
LAGPARQARKRVLQSWSQVQLSAAATSDESVVPAPAPAPDVRDRARGRWRWENVSLLWRVFAANIVVFVVAFALLAWAPVTVHRVATPPELLILSIGLAVMLGVDLALVRRALGPPLTVRCRARR